VVPGGGDLSPWRVYLKQKEGGTRKGKCPPTAEPSKTVKGQTFAMGEKKEVGRKEKAQERRVGAALAERAGIMVGGAKPRKVGCTMEGGRKPRGVQGMQRNKGPENSSSKTFFAPQTEAVALGKVNFWVGDVGKAGEAFPGVGPPPLYVKNSVTPRKGRHKKKKKWSLQEAGWGKGR